MDQPKTIRIDHDDRGFTADPGTPGSPRLGIGPSPLAAVLDLLQLQMDLTESAQRHFTRSATPSTLAIQMLPANSDAVIDKIN